MVLYPTEQWLREYKQRLTDSDALTTLGAGWGVGFNGDFLVVITDVPLDETTIGDLPEEALDGVPGFARKQLMDVTLTETTTLINDKIRWLLPERQRDLLRQLDEHVAEDTIYAFIGLKDGGCTEVDVLASPDEREVGFVLRGSYETWQQIIDGELALVPLVRGDLTVQGSRLRLLQYVGAIQLLGEIAADIETTHLFQRGRRSTDDRGTVVREVVRQPRVFQRVVHERVQWVTQKLRWRQ